MPMGGIPCAAARPTAHAATTTASSTIARAIFLVL
jgi:hypothetical protein